MYVSLERNIRAEDRYLLCFFVGLIAGTVMANFWYPLFMEEAGYYLSLLDRNINLNKGERIQLFYQVLRQRGIEVWIAWLIGLTSCVPYDSHASGSVLPFSLEHPSFVGNAKWTAVSDSGFFDTFVSGCPWECLRGLDQPIFLKNGSLMRKN